MSSPVETHLMDLRQVAPARGVTTFDPAEKVHPDRRDAAKVERAAKGLAAMGAAFEPIDGVRHAHGLDEPRRPAFQQADVERVFSGKRIGEAGCKRPLAEPLQQGGDPNCHIG